MPRSCHPSRHEACAHDGGRFRQPGFLRFWTAESISDLGSYVTTISLQVLVVVTLDGTASDVGLRGFLADSVGYRPVLWAGVAGFLVVTTGLAFSPFRDARHGD